MDDRNRLALRLSHDLAGVTDRETYLNAMIESLAVVFPCDSNGWVGMDLPRGRYEFYGTNGSGDLRYASGVQRMKDAHPMMMSYLTRPGDIGPRRMSDIIGDLDWLNHPLYRELFVPLGARRELTIAVSPVSPVEFDGWGFHRATRDFSDAEMQTATDIQAVLVTLNRLTLIGTKAAPGPARHRLTAREAQILQLVAQGFRARDIAVMLRISASTVRKHLEHVYDKLGEHNRVRAIGIAVRDGDITP
jgi:DNA-binding CsgD family transcriptional regulator